MSFEIWNRRYTGSKYKLADWIFDIIDKHCKGDSFCDIFAGTGIIAHHALSRMKSVAVNDFLFSNEIIYKAFFLQKVAYNHHCNYGHHGIDREYKRI